MAIQECRSFIPSGENHEGHEAHKEHKEQMGCIN